MKNNQSMELFEKIGLFEYISSTRKKEIVAQLSEGLDIQSIIADFAFDSETIQTDTSYTKILNKFAKHSAGYFTPQNIKETYQDNLVSLSFENNGQKFETTFSQQGDWFNSKLIDLINQSLDSTGTKCRFIELPATDQLINITFIPPHIYNALVKSGVLPSLNSKSSSPKANLESLNRTLDAIENKYSSKNQTQKISKIIRFTVLIILIFLLLMTLR